MDTGTHSGQAALFDTSSEPASPVHVTGGPVVMPATRGGRGSSNSSAVPSLEDRAYATRLAIHTYWVGLLVSVAAALVVILTAIDVQSGRIPDTEGHGWAFSTLFGPDFGSGLNEQGLTVLTTEGELTAGGLKTLERLLAVHLVVDSIFAAVYAALLWLTVRTVAKGWWRTAGYVAVGLLLVADLLENLLAFLVFFADWSMSAVPIFTAAKWFLAIIVVAIVALSLIVPLQSADQRSPRKRLGRGFTALLHQRYSYVPVLAIFILSIPSGAAILEQLPDVQRRWVFDGSTGLRHALAAMISTTALGLYLLAVGRRRTVSALGHRRRSEPDGKRSTAAYASTAMRTAEAAEPKRRRYYGVWVVPPAAALLGFAVIIAAGRSELILQGRFLVFIGVPLLLVIAGSAITGRIWGTKIAQEHGWPRPYQQLTYTLEEAFAIGIAGTIAGVAAVVVGGLSLLRAFTPLVILPAVEYVPVGGDPANVVRKVAALLAVGAVAVIIPWLLMIILAKKVGGPTRPPLHWQRSRFGQMLLGIARRMKLTAPLRFLWHRGAWILLLITVAVFLGLGLLPRFAAWIGLSATATLALGALAGILSATALVLQDRPTAEIFRLFRLRRTPLVSLLVLTILLASLFSGGGGIHDVNPGPAAASTTDVRPTMQRAFDDWYVNAAKCELTVGTYRVRPMIMVAAEGGGIRASYWTVRGLQAISDETCGKYSTLFSAGASGGSVGLTVARFSGAAQDPGRAAVDAVKEIAKPQILSRAADGTFIRDLLYGATGLPVPRIGEQDGWDWRDRARLIEDGWAESSGWGNQRFLGPDSTLSSATGQLILNSTSVKDNCRVWVSQVQVAGPATDPSPSFDPEKNCDKNPGAATRTIDLFRAYGPYTDDGSAPTCLGSISSATAALLTARFPYVTPSGVVGPCPDREVRPGQRTEPYWPETQLVDGGYIENSGLATITDLSDQWVGMVRETNRRALTGNSPEPALVVPIIVFLTNADRNASQPALDASPTSELAVPPRTYIRGGGALDSNEALLGRAQDAVALDGFCSSTLDQPACSALQRRFPTRVVVVDRLTQPEIGAPLGWVLSGASITSMDNAMIAQLETHCPANQPDGGTPSAGGPSRSDGDVICRAGLATLGDLERYFTFTSPS